MQVNTARSQRSMGLSPSPLTGTVPGSPMMNKITRAQTGLARGNTCKKMWDEAEKRFNSKIAAAGAKRTLSSTRGKDLEQVLRDFQEKYHASTDDDSIQRQRASQAIQNTLKCIQLLGGLVAQGASMVFAPANLCFSAISALIDIPARITKVYEDISQMFFKIETFMMTFKIFDNIDKLQHEIDDTLVITATQIMVCVVDICALAIEFTGRKRDRFIKTAKIVLFDDDSGVKSMLDTLGQLTERQKLATQTLTLQEVLTTKTEMRDYLFKQNKQLADLKADMGDALRLLHVIEADSTERKSGRAVTERRNQIAKRLSAYSNMSSEVSRMRELLAKASFEINGEESCKWLSGNAGYQSWLKKEKAILVLEGPAKTGKTVLCSAIVKRWPRQQQTKSVVASPFAYYAFEQRDSKSNKDNFLDREIVHTAFKCMAVQLADQHVEYARALHEDCGDEKGDDYFNESSLSKLWQKLKLSYCGSQSQCDFLLIFDGVDRLPAKEAKELVSMLKNEVNNASSRLQRVPWILATSETSTSGNQHLMVIKPAEHNEGDIVFYINRYLQAKDTFVGDDSELMRAVKRIRKHLPRLVEGNFGLAGSRLDLIRRAIEADFTYRRVRTLIEDVNSKEGEDELRERQGDLTATEANTTREELDKITKNLDNKSLDELQELLIWAVFAYKWPTVEELKAAWFARYLRTPVQSLKNKLTGKYNDIFELKEGAVYVKDQFMDYYTSQPSATNKQESQALSTARISMDLTIQQGNTTRHRKFVWNLNEQDLRDSTQISLGELSASIKTNSSIEIDPVSAHYRIALCCLRLLNERPNKRTSALIPYALKSLPFHLIRLYEDKAQLGRGPRSAIAKALVDLLSDVDAIEKHWQVESDLAEDWLDDDEAIVTVRSWLKDARARHELEPRERRWVDGVGQEYGRGTFWAPITIMVAKHWLRRRDWRAGSAFQWVDSFLAMQRRGAQEEREKWENFDEESLPSEGESTEDEDDDELPNSSEPNINGTNERSRERSYNDDSKTESHSSVSPTRSFPSSQHEEDEDSETSRLSRAPSFMQSMKERIDLAAEWASEYISHEKDSLWHERLGATYLFFDQLPAALEAFETANSMPDAHWKVSEGLGIVYDLQNHYSKAAECFERAVAGARKAMNTPSMDMDFSVEDKRNALIRTLMALARLRSQLKEYEVAEQLLGDSLNIRPNVHETECKWRLVKTMWNAADAMEESGKVEEVASKRNEAKDKLLAMSTEFKSGDGISCLADLLCAFAAAASNPKDFNLLLSIHRDGHSQVLLEAIQSAIVYRADEDSVSHDSAQVAWLYVFQGMTSCYRSSDKTKREFALKSWQECCKIAESYEHERSWQAKANAVDCMTMCHFDLARANPKPSEEALREHLDYLKTTPHPYSSLKGSTYLGSYYADIGESSKALEEFHQDIVDALDILTDNDPDNDEFAFWMLFEVFIHVQDWCNALSAWSLRGSVEEGNNTISRHGDDHLGGDENLLSDQNGTHEPKPREFQPREKPTEKLLQCDGSCGQSFTYADEVWACIFCPNTAFCRKCKDKVKNCKLDRYCCSSDHDWFCVPAMSEDDYKQLNKLPVGREPSLFFSNATSPKDSKQVRLYTEDEDGSRTFRLGTLAEWVAEIREIWDIEESEIQSEREEDFVKLEPARTRRSDATTSLPYFHANNSGNWNAPSGRRESQY